MFVSMELDRIWSKQEGETCVADAGVSAAEEDGGAGHVGWT